MLYILNSYVTGLIVLVSINFFIFFYFFLKHELIALPYLSEIERNESVVYNITNPIDHWTRDTLA